MENVIGAVLLIGIVVTCFAIISPTVIDMVTSYTEVIKAHTDSMKRFTYYLNSLEFNTNTIYETQYNHTKNSSTNEGGTGNNIDENGDSGYFPHPELKYFFDSINSTWHFFSWSIDKLDWVELKETTYGKELVE